MALEAFIHSSDRELANRQLEHLVFWFGSEAMPPPPHGSLPVAADELRMRLESTLTEAERRKISVVVVDLSGTGLPCRCESA